MRKGDVTLKLFRVLSTLAIGITLSSQAGAVLAPNYQRLAELKAILADATVIQTFDVKHPIEKIEYVEKDHYRITSGSCHLDVRIADAQSPQHRVGPRQFDLKVGMLSCL